MLITYSDDCQCMIIHVVGGFLGSGKTTLLIKIAERYIADGKKVTILVNEAGEIGVDGASISSNGLNAIQLQEGCICCTLSGTLQSTMRDIERELDPDVVIIEPTGLALPHKVRELIRGTVSEDEINTIGICDAMRFDRLREKKEDFLRMQLQRSDVLWISRRCSRYPHGSDRYAPTYRSSWSLEKRGRDSKKHSPSPCSSDASKPQLVVFVDLLRTFHLTSVTGRTKTVLCLHVEGSVLIHAQRMFGTFLHT